MIPLLKGAVLCEPPAHAREREEIATFCRCEGDDWQAPRWNEGGPVHNWRNYATPPLKRLWPTLTDEQKMVIAFTLQVAADAENWE